MCCAVCSLISLQPLGQAKIEKKSWAAIKVIKTGCGGFSM